MQSIERVCTKDANTCTFGFCIFNKKCATTFYTDIPPTLSDKQKARQVRKKMNFKGGGLLKSASQILGEDIFNHDLVKGDSHTISLIKAAKSYKELINILQDKYKRVSGRYRIIPQGRKLYWKYKNENQ